MSPEFNLVLERERYEAAELVLKIVGSLEREWVAKP